MLFFRSKASTYPQWKLPKRWHCNWELLCFLRRGWCLSAWRWRWVLLEKKSNRNGLTYVHFQIHMKVDLRWEPCSLRMELSLPSIPAPMKSDIDLIRIPKWARHQFYTSRFHHAFCVFQTQPESFTLHVCDSLGKKEMDAKRALTFLFSWMRWKTGEGGMERWKELKRLSREYGTCYLCDSVALLSLFCYHWIPKSLRLYVF